MGVAVDHRHGAETEDALVCVVTEDGLRSAFAGVGVNVVFDPLAVVAHQGGAGALRGVEAVLVIAP